MTKRRRILHSDKIIRNAVQVFCLLMFLQLKGYYSLSSNSMLLYSTASDIRVANVTRIGKASPIIKGLEQGSAVDFLYRRNLICWLDQAVELIQCAYYNGTVVGEKMRLVSEGLIAPMGIAIDWLTEKLYWTDGENKKIEVIDFEFKYRKVLFWSDVDLARAIAVAPLDKLMFWTDLGEIPKIERAGMNGDPSTRKVIVKDNIQWPNGITIDHSNKLIYWFDLKLRFIDVIDFNGENRKRIVNQDSGLVYQLALAYYNDKLFWTDYTTRFIHSWDITTNGPTPETYESEALPLDLRFFDEEKQKLPNEYPCKVNNSGCSHLCLLSPNPPGYTCACPTGTKLREGSNTICYSAPQTMLIVAQRLVISRISLDSPDFTPYTMPLKDVRRAISVDFDPKTEFIYWADNVTKSISRARLDGSDQSVVIHQGIGVPDSIAIDRLARNIYWSDPADDTICVARLDGSYKKVIIHDDLYEPRAIALYPTVGLMFWSDWSDKRPKIERANLDGSNRTAIVTEKLAWPNGIALDMVKNKLYWGDARTHKIEVCNLDGSERREIHGNDIMHIFGLTLLDDQLYWTDMQRRTLDRINKYTGSDRQPVVEQMANMMGLKAFRLGEKLGWNPCVDNNGGCSHLCFNRPKDFVCSCPLGLELGSDGKNCIEPEAFLVYSRKNIIGRISIENENNDAILPLKDLKEVSALAVHVAGSKIYWSDSKSKTINRCSINGSNMEKILEWTGLVEGIAIDWAGQNIVWTDSVLQRIEVARLDGSSRRTLIWQGLKKPKSIALNPKKGHMYWSELGSKTIKRAAMDGSSTTVIIEQVGKVNALSIDYDRRAIYWAAIEPSSIEFAHLDGSGRKKLVTEDVPTPYALTLYGDKLFWGDWTTGDIEVLKKPEGTGRMNVHKRLDYISDLKVFHKSRNSGGNQCSVDNGGCTNLCLAIPSEDGRPDYKCACPTHHKLNKDNLTCSEPDEFILFAQKNAVGRIVVANGECTDTILPISGFKNIKTVEYDPAFKNLYWMDDDSIRRIPISLSASTTADSTLIISGLIRPFHMVIDALGRGVYWTRSDGDSINATGLDSNATVGSVVSGESMMPRHLALHVNKRVLIWNDLGLSAIMVANLDGTDMYELVKASNATALCIDHNTDTVYWAMNRQIHAVEMDGSNKRVVWQGGVATSLCAAGGHVVWAGGGGGGGGGTVQRVPAARRDHPAHSVPHVTRVLALSAHPHVSASGACWRGGGCGAGAGRCLRGGACGCGVSCASPERPASPAHPAHPAHPASPPHCPPHHFPCATPTHHCLPNAWRCDTQTDCADASDESPQECGGCSEGVRCAEGSCAATLSACRDGAWCVHRHMPDAFRCDNRLCLPPRLLCDGFRHCEDGEDEAPATCLPQQNIPPESSRQQSNAFYVTGSILCCVLGGAAAWLGVRRWRNYARRRRENTASQHHNSLRLYPRKPSDHHNMPSFTDTSDSVCERYRPTVNPPPSPATASGGSAAGNAAASSARGRRAYRHYRSINRPPPPTPASTDACESDTGAHRAPPPSPNPTDT